jgi:hypothetical protein
MLGLLIGGSIMLGISWACFRIAPGRLDRWFRRSQLVTSALYSIGHGSNDAQKTMGIIWLLLMSQGLATPDHLADCRRLSFHRRVAASQPGGVGGGRRGRATYCRFYRGVVQPPG